MRIMLEDGLEELGCFEGEGCNFHPISQHLAVSQSKSVFDKYLLNIVSQ